MLVYGSKRVGVHNYGTWLSYGSTCQLRETGNDTAYPVERRRRLRRNDVFIECATT